MRHPPAWRFLLPAGPFLFPGCSAATLRLILAPPSYNLGSTPACWGMREMPVRIRLAALLRAVYQINEFDAEVNALLADGWTMKRRKLIGLEGEQSDAYSVPVVKALYAELERQAPEYPEESTI